MNIKELSSEGKIAYLIKPILKVLQEAGGQLERSEIKERIADLDDQIAEYAEIVKKSKKTGSEYKEFNFKFNFAIKDLYFNKLLTYCQILIILNIALEWKNLKHHLKPYTGCLIKLHFLLNIILTLVLKNEILILELFGTNLLVMARKNIRLKTFLNRKIILLYRRCIGLAKTFLKNLKTPQIHNLKESVISEMHWNTSM